MCDYHINKQTAASMAADQNRMTGNTLGLSNVPAYIQDLQTDIQRLEYKIDKLIDKLDKE